MVVFKAMGMMMFMASSNTILQVKAPPRLAGRVMSLRALVLLGMGAPGAVLMGRLAEFKHIGAQGTILIGALVGLVTSTFFAVTMRPRKKCEPTAAPIENSAVGVDNK